MSVFGSRDKNKTIHVNFHGKSSVLCEHYHPFFEILNNFGTLCHVHFANALVFEDFDWDVFLALND